MAQKKLRINSNDYRNVRLIMNYTQKQMGEILGVSAQTICKRENNGVATISSAEPRLIAKEIRKEVRNGNLEKTEVVEKLLRASDVKNYIAVRKIHHRKDNIKLNGSAIAMYAHINEISQGELADAIGYSSSGRVSTLLNGGGKVHPEKLHALAKYLNMSIEEAVKLFTV